MGGRYAALPQVLELLQKRGNVQRNTIADDVGNVREKYAGRQLVQGEFPVIADDGMAGIGAALEPDDNVRSLRKEIGDLPLAFIAPVGSDDGFDHN